MELSSRIAVIIYVLVFVFAKLFHCIDVSNGTAVGSDANNDDSNISNSNETVSLSDQTTKLDGGIQPQENGNADAMQMCNQSFPTPKGTVYGYMRGIAKCTKIRSIQLKQTK